MSFRPSEPSPLAPDPGGVAPGRFYSGVCVFDFAKPALRCLVRGAAARMREVRRDEPGSYLLLLADRGPCACRVNATLIVLQPGDLLIVRPQDEYAEAPGADGAGRVLGLGFELTGEGARIGREVMFNAELTPEQQIVRGHGAAFRPVIERMCREAEHGDPWVGRLQDALLLELLCELARVLTAGSLSPTFFLRGQEQKLREQLVRLFELKRGGPLSVPGLARELRLSVRTLTKRSQEVLGRPPKQAFEHFKMTRAALALRGSDTPIKAISGELGYRNQYHFSRRFSQLMGMSPSHYRAATNPAAAGQDHLIAALASEPPQARSA